MIFAHSAALAKLDDATRKAIVDAAARAETRGWQMARGEQTEKLAALAEKGMKVQPPSPELATGFRKIGETLTEEWIAKASADGKAAVEAYKKM